MHEASKRVFIACFMYSYGCVLDKPFQNDQPVRGHLDITNPYSLKSNPNAEFSSQFWILCNICGQMFYKSYDVLLSHEHLQLNHNKLDWRELHWSFECTLQLKWTFKQTDIKASSLGANWFDNGSSIIIWACTYLCSLQLAGFFFFFFQFSCRWSV